MLMGGRPRLGSTWIWPLRTLSLLRIRLSSRLSFDTVDTRAQDLWASLLYGLAIA
jgi:hypothetical protein